MQTETTFKQKFRAFRSRKHYWVLALVMMLILAAVQCLVIDLSANTRAYLSLMDRLSHILDRPFLYTVAELVLVLTVNSILLLIFGRMGSAALCSTLLSAALSLTNYVVNLLHGTPFTLDMIRNTGTALQVLSSYSIPISLTLICILAGIGFMLLITLVFLWNQKVSRKRVLIPGILLAVLLYPFYLSPAAVIPSDCVSWSWIDSVEAFGYLNCLTNATLQSFHPAQEPAAYDEQALEDFTETYQVQSSGNAHPDVILILNETFYDLSQITDVQADQNYLSHIQSLDNAVSGYAVVPGVGGGTNRSEYEYLTSNSLQVAPNITPFNSFRIQDAGSVVSLLEAQGYETAAIHYAPAQNYNRQASYPAMGFDTIHFEEDFRDMENFPGRHFATDATVYQNMFRWYEEMGEGPRLFYTLTIQNHGGYDQMDPADYTVRTQGDFGDNTNPVNEFLSLISEADRAFGDIVDYFRDSERDVIVCMVGDHGPSFIRDVADSSLTPEQLELRLRSVPYVIWSNHLELSRETPERFSLNYLVPTVLDLAGIRLSPYYDFLLNLREQVPVISAYNVYMTADGAFHTYGTDAPQAEAVNTCLGLDYANITQKDFMVPFTAPASP